MSKKMEFNDKARVVAECWMVARDAEAWDEILNYGDLGFPLAYAHLADLANVEDEGKKLIIDVYEVIVKSLEVPEDKYYAGFEEMLDVKIEQQESEQ